MARSNSGTGRTSIARLLRRYLWLYDTLARSRGLTREEISLQWEKSPLNELGEPLSERTFHEHKNAVMELFEVEISCNKKAGNRYTIDTNSIRGQKKINQWLLDNFTFNTLFHQYQDIHDRVIFEEVPSYDSVYLFELLDAIQQNRQIEIEYQSFALGGSATLRLYPFALRLFKQRWYLIAKEVKESDLSPFGCYDEEGIDLTTGLKIYGLDRLHGLTLLEETFEYPKDFNMESLFEDCYGIILGDDPFEYITIRATRKQANYIRTLPLHHSQKEYPCKEDDNYVIFKYKLRPTFDLFQTLLSMGGTIEVLEPEWVRQEFVKWVDDLYHLYNKDK
nr:WYL domain-containing protein [uncultured Porphyromonas sp.]